MLSSCESGPALPGNKGNQTMKTKIIKGINQHGFTLVELLVAIAISGIVMAGVYSVYYSQQKSYMAQEQVAVMQQNLRAAMLFMEREIRMAGCDPTGQAVKFADWNISSSNSFKFTLDIRGSAVGSLPDGDTNDPNEDITYALDGTDLERNDNLIAENITSLNFVYLDGVNLPTTSKSAVRAVEITVVAATEDNVRSRSFTTNIKCRNMGL